MPYRMVEHAHVNVNDDDDDDEQLDAAEDHARRALLDDVGDIIRSTYCQGARASSKRFPKAKMQPFGSYPAVRN
jgi:hypothetical protein